MADFTTLAEFESLLNGKDDAGRYNLVHTVRDYMPLFDQAIIQEANDGTRDKATILTQYPTGTARGYNEGWDAESVVGTPAVYEAAMIRTRSSVDLELYKKKGPKAAEWRLGQDEGFQKGLAKAAAARMFYGDRTADARDVLGLAAIVNSTNGAFANRIIDAGGTGSGTKTDIWLINWDKAGAYLFYPQYGSEAGLQMEDMGEQYVEDRNGKKFRALVTEFGWDIGVALYNPECVVRIANVDTATLKKSGASGADLVDLLTQAAEMIPDQNEGHVSFYCNDTIRSVLRRQIQNRNNAALCWDEVAGRRVVMFGDIPVHKLGNDIIPNTL